MGHLFIVFVICSLCNEMENLKLVCVFFQILEVIIFCTLLFVQWRYDLENVVIFLLLVALLGTDFLTFTLRSFKAKWFQVFFSDLFQTYCNLSMPASPDYILCITIKTLVSKPHPFFWQSMSRRNKIFKNLR